MRKNLCTILAALMVVGILGFAGQAIAGTQAAPGTQAKAATSTPAHHGHEMKGAITAYDEAAKSLKLKDAAGKEKEFILTTATAIHGTIKVGENATVRYMVKDSKDVATSIRIAAPAAAQAAPAPKK